MQVTRNRTRRRACAVGGVALTLTALTALEAPARGDTGGIADRANRPGTCTPRILDYGALPGDRFSEILAGNRHGVLIGSSHNGFTDSRAVRWVGRRPIDLGAHANAWAADINDSGVIVGNANESRRPGTTERAFRWRAGHLRTLPGLGGWTFVRRINEGGVAAGSAVDSRGREQPVTWHGFRLHRLGLPAGYDGAAGLGINDAGDVAGIAYTRHRAAAWLWPARGGSRALDRLGGFSQANVLDNAGRAYGLSDFGGRPGAEAAVWPRPGRVRGLGHLAAGDFSFALGANGLGDAVGVGNYRAGVDENHVLWTSLDVDQPRTMLPLSGDYRDDSKAHYVSETRPIVVGGSSATRSGESHATLWTCVRQQAFVPPVPPRQMSGKSAPLRTLDVAARSNTLSWLRR